MKNIRFIPSGKPVSDFEISKFVDAIFASSETEFSTSTHLVIEEIRARVVEKKLKLDDFQIWIQGDDGKEMKFNMDVAASSDDWQKSQDVWSDILNRVLGI